MFYETKNEIEKGKKTIKFIKLFTIFIIFRTISSSKTLRKKWKNKQNYKKRIKNLKWAIKIEEEGQNYNKLNWKPLQNSNY